MSNINPSTRTVRSINPCTREVLVELPCAGKEEVAEAVASAWRRFERDRSIRPGPDQRLERIDRSDRTDLRSRLKKISKLRSLLASRADEIATLISLEVGKPTAEAYSSEISGVLDTCAWLVNNAEKHLAKYRVKLGNPLARSKRCSISHEPLGVIGIISPWNFPFAIPMSTALAAVAAGNSVIIKPSEKSSLTGLRIEKLFADAGFDPDTVQVIVGDGETGKELSSSRLSRLVFTGSVGAGQRIVSQTASSLTPVTLELGGKDAAIVLPDAPVDFTAAGLTWGAFFNAGQACASIERVYVVRGPKTDELINAIVERTRRLKVGPPEDSQSEVGPLIDQAQLNKVSDHVRQAREQGAKVLCGGRDLPELGGFYYEPTVLVDVEQSMEIMTEETFGPALPIMVVDSVEQAIELANDSEYGLTGSVWSASTIKAEAVARRLRVGTAYVNECIFSHAAPELPWGGLKKSGIGRSHSHIGLLDMVHLKNTNVGTASGAGQLWWYPYGEGSIKLMRGGVQLLHGSFPWDRIKGVGNIVSGFLGRKK